MSYAKELEEAKETFELSGQTARRYVRHLGALTPIIPGSSFSKKPGFQMTVLEQRYWFAKLYEMVTYEEIDFSVKTKYPGFSLHFIKVFYTMYYNAMQNFDANLPDKVNPLWVTHFKGPPMAEDRRPPPDSFGAVEFSIRTGATAHIQGDMPVALAVAYRTWQTDSKPSFQDLRDDFITRSESAFSTAQARFYLEVNDKTMSPVRPEVGQLGAVFYQKIFNIQPSLDVMFGWRREAWQKAADALKAAAAATP